MEKLFEAGPVLWQHTSQVTAFLAPTFSSSTHRHESNSLSTQLHTKPKGSVPFLVKVINCYHDAINYQVEQLLAYAEES